MSPKQALSQIVTAWQGLAFPLKGRRKEGSSEPGQRLPLPAHHGRPCPSSRAAPQLGSRPQFLHPRTWPAPRLGKQITVNERSSLTFPAHFLLKQPPDQQHPCHPTPLGFSASSRMPLPLLDLPTPCLQPGHLLPLHGWGRGRPVTLLLPGRPLQAPLCPLATSRATPQGKLGAGSLQPRGVSLLCIPSVSHAQDLRGPSCL